MKGPLIFATVFVLLSPSFCINIQSPNSSGRKGYNLVSTGFIRPTYDAARIGGDNSKCSFCVQFMGQAINELLNIILNMGVVGGCGEICGLLEQKTGSKALGVACNLLCDIVGVEEFVKIINMVDPDPIFICEEFKTCAINDNGDCKITVLDVQPKSGPQGEFTVGFTFVSHNGTGTGEISIDIETVDHIPVGDAFLHEAEGNGTFPGTISLKAQPDPSCDPTQQPCEQWLPGTYTVKLAICNGECGSKHPHSKIYDKAQTTFTITS